MEPADGDDGARDRRGRVRLTGRGTTGRRSQATNASRSSAATSAWIVDPDLGEVVAVAAQVAAVGLDGVAGQAPLGAQVIEVAAEQR